MNQHALTTASDKGVAASHVSRGILVGAPDYFRHGRAKLPAICQFLDERRVVGSEIAEQILDTDLRQAFEEEVCGGAGPGIGAGVHFNQSIFRFVSCTTFAQ